MSAVSNIHEILNIPKYYTNVLMNINSERIKRVLKNDLMKNFRELYQSDSKLFYHVRDELILRGIGFRSTYQNNYLLELPYEIENILYKDEDTKGFKEIEFGLMGANNFIDRFNIQSDLFFNGVPLEGLHYFMVGTSINMLKSMVENVGFSVVPVEKFYFNNYEIKKKDLTDQIAEKQEQYVVSRGDLSIEKLFNGDDLANFREFCQENNKSFFNELTLDFMREFEHKVSVKVKATSKALTIFNQVNKDFYYLFTRMNTLIEKYQNNIFKDLLEEYDTDYLDFLDDFYRSENERVGKYPFKRVENIVQEKLNLRKKDKFKELIHNIKEHRYFEYIENLTLLNIKKMIAPNINIEGFEEFILIECFNDLQYQELMRKLLTQLDNIMEITEVFESMLAQLTDRELEVLELRQTMTLQEVGDQLGITRERVRQIQAKALKNFFDEKYIAFLKLYIYHYTTDHSRFIRIEDFMNYYELNDRAYGTLLQLVFDKKQSITYVKELDVYIGSEEYGIVSDILSGVGVGNPIIKIDDIKEYLEEDDQETYLKFIDLFLRSQKYIRADSIYVKEKITIVARVNYLFENVITKPLEMNDEGYDFFKKLMVDTFKIPFESSKRSATARIADGDNVILVDSNTFFYHDTKDITNEFLYRLEIIIDEQLEENHYVNPRLLFTNYQDLMEQARIISPVHLYSIIQIYLGEKYDTGHGNTLYVYKANEERIDAETILLNYLKKYNGEAKKDTVMKDLKWKEYKLDQLLSRIKSVLLIGNRMLKTVESFNFKEEELKNLENEVKKYMSDGYVFIHDLHFELGFNEEFGGIVQKYGLGNDMTLASLLKFLMPDLQGHSKLLYWKDNPITKLEQAIAKEFPSLMSRHEMIQFIKEKGYSEQTISGMLLAVIDGKHFYHYTTVQYINANQIQFTEEVKESLSNYLKKQMNDRVYQSTYSMVGFTHEIEAISSYKWTEWLIYQFAEQVGYKRIDLYNDYRYDKLILVKESSGIKSYEELVLYILENEYEGRKHESDLAHYLEKRNVLQNPRQLPSVIRQSPNFKFDSFGFFEVIKGGS